MRKKELKEGTKVLMNNIRINRYTPDGCFMPDEMEKDIGKVYTIDYYMHCYNGETRYKIKENTRWTYTDDMFSVYAPKNVIGGQVLDAPSLGKLGTSL